MTESKTITAYKLQLRDRIVDTSMKAFAAQGVRAVKMDDIAQTLGISKRTLYELYENKEDLLCAGLKKYRDQKEHEMIKCVSQSENVIDVILYAYRSKVEEFKVTVPQFYADLERYPSVMALLEENREVYRQQLMRFLMRGVKEGYFRSDVNYNIVLYLFEAIGQQIMGNKLYRKFGIEQLFYNLVFTSIRGICTPRGVEILDRS